MAWGSLYRDSETSDQTLAGTSEKVQGQAMESGKHHYLGPFLFILTFDRGNFDSTSFIHPAPP